MLNFDFYTTKLKMFRKPYSITIQNIVPVYLSFLGSYKGHIEDRTGLFYTC